MSAPEELPQLPANLMERTRSIRHSQGWIDCYWPIVAADAIDPLRTISFHGRRHVLINGAPTEVEFPIPGVTLAEAVAAWPAALLAAKKEIESRLFAQRMAQPVKRVNGSLKQ